MTDCLEALKSRRSIRKFQNKPPSTEQLEIIIEAARLAPSGRNRQPWRFVLLQGDERDRIAGAVVQPFVLQAPVVFVCCLDQRAFLRSQIEQRMQELVKAEVVTEEAADYIYRSKLPEDLQDVVAPASAYLDLGIAVQNMVIAATALGLGSCWVRMFDQARVHELLTLPEYIEVVSLLPIGYPDQAPSVRPRLSQSEIMLDLKK